MQCLQLTRGEPPATTVVVTITGSGSQNKCYAIINGTEQYSAGTHEVNTGDTITFGVFGISSKNYGMVKIDGTIVLSANDGSVKTYDWTVPRGISAIEIAMSFVSNTGGIVYSRITVTTA